MFDNESFSGTLRNTPDRKILKLDPVTRIDSVDEILTGLTVSEKYIPSHFFYDAAGSLLFEKITKLEEYYPARTEKGILLRYAIEMTRSMAHSHVIELGSGDPSKISILFAAIPPVDQRTLTYNPVDVSPSAIQGALKQLKRDFPDIHTMGIVSDFRQPIRSLPEDRPRIFCFFGSTLGNLSREEGLDFLNELYIVMNSGDEFLLGLDMIKNIGIMEGAYNDPEGVTSEFNRNIIRVVNRIAEMKLDAERFAHVSFYNERENRIEMHLKALERMESVSPYYNGTIIIEKGETIHTENSHKYSMDHILGMSEITGLGIKDIYTDENKWFSIVHFQKP